MPTDYELMERCVWLAQRSAGYTAPNPMVGAVLVYDDKIIGEGWHQQFGEAHAEVNCINNVKEADRKFIPAATLYVSLEPCNHFGKTPPCTDLIISSGIKKVMVGCVDIHEKVAGTGIAKLRAAGIEVTTGINEQACLQLNKRFNTFHRQKRPYIILKWAVSDDGFIAGKNFERIKITDSDADLQVHQWRSEEAAIMVGTNTALHDNPQLTIRHITGKQPLRVVIDKNNQIPSTHFLLADEHPTLIFSASKEETNGNKQWMKIDFSKKALPQILECLYQKNILSVLVEGGATLHQYFINEQLWDEARIISNHQLTIQHGVKQALLNVLPHRTEQLGKHTISYFIA